MPVSSLLRGAGSRSTHAVLLLGALSATAMVPAVAGAKPVARASALSVQGESLTLPAKKGQVVTDKAADGGRSLLIWSSAAATTTTNLSAGQVTVRARGQLCDGAPKMTVDIDGRSVLRTDVTSTAFKSYTAASATAAGRHTMKVSFTNDVKKRGCDRNLFIDSVKTLPAGSPTAPNPHPTSTPAAPPVPTSTPMPAPTSAPAPQPTPTPVSTPGAVDGTMLFDGNFSGGLSSWTTRIHTERISFVPDPILGSQRTVAKYTVYDGDTSPTPNPRAQLEGPANMRPGGDYWVGWSTLFPTDFPTLPAGGWLTFAEIYGAPYAGAGPMGIRVHRDNIVYDRNANYGYDVPFSTPIQRGRWTDFVLHVKLSSDPSVGFIEIYMNTGNGWQQQSLAGRQRLYTKTIDSSNNGGANNFRMNNYRKKGMFDVVTLYQASPKVGTSFNTVAPHSY